MASFDPKPALWAFDFAAVDPFWLENFWRDCIACVPAWENAVGQAPMILGSNWRTANYAAPTFCTAVGTAGWSAVQNAPGLGFPASLDDFTIPGDASGVPQDIVPLNRVTYLQVRRKRTALITSATSFGLHTAGGSRAGGHVPFSDGNVVWDFGGQSGVNRLVWGGYTPATNVEAWAFVAGTMGSAIYFNGLQVASQATAIVRNKTTSGQQLSLNMGNGSSDSMPVDVMFFAVLDAEWTAGQVAEWAQDPYAPLRMADYSINTGSAVIFRKMFSPIGGRIGSRQPLWM